MVRKVGVNIAYMAAAIVVILIAYVFLEDYLGFDADTSENFALLGPGLLVTGVGLGVAIAIKGVFIIAGMGIAGFGFAYLSGQMYELGYISDQMLTGLTIGEEMNLLVIIFILFGFGMYWLSRRR